MIIENEFPCVNIFLLPGNPVTFQPTGPRSPSMQGTNMEELLKGIPPNVAIKTISDQQAGKPSIGHLSYETVTSHG